MEAVFGFLDISILGFVLSLILLFKLNASLLGVDIFPATPALIMIHH